MSSDKKIIEKINEYLFAKENFALALVLETWNSAPKPVGSILLVSESGEISGSVSGGCVEGAVISEAQISLKTQKSKSGKLLASTRPSGSTSPTSTSVLEPGGIRICCS